MFQPFVGLKMIWETIEGAGVQGIFLMFLVEENESYQDLFRNEKILFPAKVIALLNLKNKYNYIARSNFNRDFPKIDLKLHLLLQFSR